jgi:hypothetical protein
MMTKLKQVGFFKELPHGDPHAASLNESKNQLKDDLVKNISDYLESGILFIASPGVAKDVLSENKEIIGTLGILTDGVWAWPADLSYYVGKYRVGLPMDFVEYMKHNNWQKSEVNIRELEF